MSTESVTSLRPPAWDVVDWTAYWKRLSGALRQLEVDKAKVEGELAELRQERDALNENLKETGITLDETQGKCFKLFDRRDHVLEEIELLNDKKRATELQIHNCELLLRDLDSVRQQIEQHQERWSAEYDAKQRELAALSSRIASVGRQETRVRQYEQNIAAREAQVAQREIRVVQYETNVAQRENKVAYRESVVATIEARLPGWLYRFLLWMFA